MQFEQGDYVQSKGSGATGYFVRKKSEWVHCNIIELESGEGWERSNDDIPSNYVPRCSDTYLGIRKIEPHCGEATLPCEKCQESSFTRDLAFLDNQEPEKIKTEDLEKAIDGLREQKVAYEAAFEPRTKAFIPPKDLKNCFNHLTNNIMNSLKQVPKTLKRVLSSDLQKQYKAGLINGDLEITDKGKRELWMALQDKFSDELTESAEEIINEAEENQE